MPNAEPQPVDALADPLGRADRDQRWGRKRDVSWHSLSPDRALALLDGSEAGLSGDEAAERLRRFGPNRLPKAEQPGPLRLFLRQFANPLVYLLLLAALVSLVIGELADALFIFVVLQFNAVIGTLQEWKAQRSAAALDALIRQVAMVRRDGEWQELDAEVFVPGDLVRLASGSHIAADLRLLSGLEAEADESLLTGESTAVDKRPDAGLPETCPLADRHNMLYAGTTLARGRVEGVVVATGQATEIGRIARVLSREDAAMPPLIRRLEHFSRVIGLATLGLIVLLAGIQLLQGLPLATVFLVAVALAVAAIPEGLPIAITVALAIATSRLQLRRVIVRSLPAVEGLGACTLIASDKTGTLTRNELTVTRLALFDPRGETHTLEISAGPMAGGTGWDDAIRRLAESACLCNEASIQQSASGPVAIGDTVDIAFLGLAAKLDLDHQALRRDRPPVDQIPYEPQRRFAATFVETETGAGGLTVHAKGAAEVLVPLCRNVDQAEVMARMERLAGEGFRVLAVARGEVAHDGAKHGTLEDLKGLELLGLAALIDPIRPEVPGAIDACRDAGIAVCMITGDHPRTALAIARELGLASDPGEVVSGTELAEAAADAARLDRLVARGRVFARVEPVQKLAIVESLQRAGHLVAVTGDGVNDAPALAAADIGVAMGKGGTDVARGAADLILADDNFASIVAGIEEGRAAYDNVRKLIYLLIATGLGEIVLFLLAILSGLPIPLFAVQLLWLNLVTNGIQDIALAFERGEPGVLARKPRPPAQSLFDRRMIAQVLISGGYMGTVAFVFFAWCLATGMAEAEARNLVLLLMVMFENAHAINARSERRSVLGIPLSANWFLVSAVIGAQGLHIVAMFTPWLSATLRIAPVGLLDWALVGALAVSLVLVMEAFKRAASAWNGGGARAGTA